MFKETFQSGRAVEILNPKDKNLKLGKSYQPFYDQSAKSYIFSLETHLSKIAFPSNDIDKLGLLQQYLVMQVFIPGSHNFSFELRITDRANAKRRILFTTACKDLTVNPLNARIPTDIQKNKWINLCVDIESFVNLCFGNAGHRSLDGLTIFAYCKLRNVFTIRSPIFDAESKATGYEPLPKHLEFMTNVDFQNLLLTSERIPKKIDGKNITTTEPFISGNISMGKLGNRTASPWNRSSIITPLVRPHKSAPLSRKNINLPPRPQKLGTCGVTPRAKKLSVGEFEVPDNSLKSQIRIRTGKTVTPPKPKSLISSGGNTPRKPPLELKPPKPIEKPVEINLYSKFQSHGKKNEEGEEVEEEILTESIEYDGKEDGSLTKTPNKMPLSFNGKSETETREINLPKPFYFEKGMWDALQHRQFSPPLVEEDNSDRKSEELKELVYDSVLKCFYSPATQEYYNVR
ncbi:unnamed protein product [Blepharisma stoltei]|uniref:CFA20 domain-containing protein n=1 Tax=Blepharisma stoltei TaxID=1481888 RepID=A0AAU9JQ85_9CILI|nr:unnamed protein product [Blepharisma stoltei]